MLKDDPVNSQKFSLKSLLLLSTVGLLVIIAFCFWILELDKSIQVWLYTRDTSGRLPESQGEYNQLVQNITSQSHDDLVEMNGNLELWIPQIPEFPRFSRCIKGETTYIYGSQRESREVTNTYLTYLENQEWQQSSFEDTLRNYEGVSFLNQEENTQLNVYLLEQGVSSGFGIDWEQSNWEQYSTIYALRFSYSDPNFADCSA